MFVILDLPTEPQSSNYSHRQLCFDPAERAFHYLATGPAGYSEMMASPENENELRMIAGCFEKNGACPGLLNKKQVEELANALIGLGRIYSKVISFFDDLPAVR